MYVSRHASAIMHNCEQVELDASDKCTLWHRVFETMHCNPPLKQLSLFESFFETTKVTSALRSEVEIDRYIGLAVFWFADISVSAKSTD